jgi:nucleotide-binding universal stress UspA family protein
MYDNILYPTDGSKGADSALVHCRHLAEASDATVHVLHSVEHFAPYGLSSDVEVKNQRGMVGDPKGAEAGMTGTRAKSQEIKERIKAHSAEMVAEVAEQLSSVETHTVVEVGTPYKVILDYAASHDVDLIVMGTHGRTGLDRYLIGSVTEKVVRMSDVPVLTVRHEDT